MIEETLKAAAQAAFTDVVIKYMLERQRGLEDALRQFRSYTYGVSEAVGDPDFTAAISEEFTIDAQWFRERIKQARELVALADQK